ncbi:hypothetical protein BU15DRAFT_68593 [Melanogaster broomeanus]|nr:hypothetical protein BU15DRAFT_68593 [Melanogaster broomeanus]
MPFSHNAKCATSLKLALEKMAGVIVSYLILNGVKFSDVKYLGTIGPDWAVEVPWYPEAIEAKWRDIERGSLTAADVLRVYYMLQCLGFSRDVTANFLELAEHWACRSITYPSVRVRKRQPQPLSFPSLPPDVPTSSIRRIEFWVKSDDNDDEETFHFVIQSVPATNEHVLVGSAMPLARIIIDPNAAEEWRIWDSWTSKTPEWPEKVSNGHVFAVVPQPEFKGRNLEACCIQLYYSLVHLYHTQVGQSESEVLIRTTST